MVNGGEAEKGGGGWSSEDLRDLFTLRQDTASDTYDSRCKSVEPEDTDAEHSEEPKLAVYQEQVRDVEVAASKADPCSCSAYMSYAA